MSTLVIALQTEGETWDELPLRTKADLTRWISREARNETEQKQLHSQVETNLAFSPFTGRVASLAVFDIERSVMAVYVVGQENTNFEQDGVVYKTRTEAKLLEEFWIGVLQYDTIVTWSGRRFGLPFLLHRSSANKIKPTVDLLEQRFLYRQTGIRHIDLLDQLTFYGAMNRRPSLYLLCAAYNLPLPPSIDSTDTLTEIAIKTATTATCMASLYEYWLDYGLSDTLGDFEF
ncbi:MAG: hypothetical protein AUK16_02740 [Parcubacteria group bacterium CG2_30_44_11]|nr:MAG: hypothetical protein AUK16_02740 [Parcubacteria group bacterium CG2_30_44_11]